MTTKTNKAFKKKINKVTMSVGVPVKLMHEGLGHTVTVEVKSGVTYRGQLVSFAVVC